MRKRKTTRRRKSNPTARGKRVVVRVNGRRGRRAAVRRRRNPSFDVGTLKDGAIVAVGSMATTFVRGMVPFSAGGTLGEVGLTFGVGWLLGEVAKRFINPSVGRLVTLGGVAAAASNALNAYNLTPQAIFAPKPPVKAVPAGAGDIVLLKGGQYDPYWGRTGGTPTGMRDIVAVPPMPRY